MTIAQPRRRTAWQKRLLLLALGCFVGLLVGEVAARALAFVLEVQKRANWERMRAGRAELPIDRDATLGEIVGPSQHPGVVYELVPNTTVRFRGVVCAIDELGFREPRAPRPERAIGDLRIVGLGDSVMFGWGVEESDCFLRRLETELRTRLPGRTVDVVNTGVPGYNTAMEVAAFEHKALHLRPDVVVLDWVGNDADLPNLVANQGSVLDPTRCFLYDLARKALGWRTRWQTGPLQDAPFTGEHYERDPDRVPPQYRDMVGEDGVRRAMDRLDQLAHEHGFRVLVASHYAVPDFVQQKAEALSWPVLDGTAAVHAALAAAGLAPADYRRSPLVLSADDPHPSRFAHASYAARLADWLLQSGWCAPRAISPR